MNIHQSAIIEENLRIVTNVTIRNNCEIGVYSEGELNDEKNIDRRCRWSAN